MGFYPLTLKVLKVQTRELTTLDLSFLILGKRVRTPMEGLGEGVGGGGALSRTFLLANKCSNGAEKKNLDQGGNGGPALPNEDLPGFKGDSVNPLLPRSTKWFGKSGQDRVQGYKGCHLPQRKKEIHHAPE